MKGILPPPKIFNTSPISKEICEILSKYPMSYWHFEKVIEEVRKNVVIYSAVDFSNNLNDDVSQINRSDIFGIRTLKDSKKNKKCKCDGNFSICEDDYNCVYLSDPPLYSIVCKECGNISYVNWNDYVYYLNEFNSSKIADALTQYEIPIEEDDCKIKFPYSKIGCISFPSLWD